MTPRAPLLIFAIGLIIPAHGFAAIVLPERAQKAIAAWNDGFSEEQRTDLRKQFGPLDASVLTDIGDYGEELQATGKNTDALHHFQFCFTFARDIQDYLQTSICEQLVAGSERLQGRYADSEAHYREALEWASHPEATHRIPLILSNLAGVYVAQGRYADALEMLDRVDTINRQNGVNNDAAPVQNRAIVYGLQGDLAHSLDQFLKALSMYEKQNDVRKIALTHYNLGILQIKQANYDAAAKELETALASQQKTGDRNRAAQSLSDLGRVRDLQGRPREALESMTRAAALAKEVNYKVGYGEALLNLGDFHQNHLEWQPAHDTYEQARLVFEELHDGYDLGIALRGLSLVALRLRQPNEALAYSSAALDKARTIGDMQGEWQAETLAGMASRAAGNNVAARKDFESAIQIIELQRGMVAGGEAERQRFFEQAVFPYQELALLAADEGAFAALQAAERARSRVLLDVLESGPDHLERLFTDQERTEENRFRASISGLNARISNAAPANVTALVEERDRLWHSYQTFLAGIYVRNPDLRHFRGASALLNEPEVSTLLDEPGTAAIEYLCAREETLIFFITRAGTGVHVQLAKLPLGRDEMQKRTARLRQMLEGRDPGYRAEARSLYRLLLGRVDTRLLRMQKRIWVIPDGPLWDVPFAALVDESGRYWIQQSAIAFTPSLTFLRDKIETPAPDTNFTRDLVAFADPERKDTTPVPELRDQVRRVAAFYDPAKSEVRVGSAAAEKSFREMAPTARVVHVAAHGIVDPGNALHSRILLSGTGGDDGWIEAWELMRMGIRADLVVLSACDTGRGQISAGEGLVGLTWSLFVAGTRNTVVSQWRVESESASELMVGLHRSLQEGRRPSEALRTSVLELMKSERFRHPMYWAAFVTVGMDSLHEKTAR